MLSSQNEEIRRTKKIKFTHMFDALRIKPKSGEEIFWEKDASGTDDAYAFSVEVDDYFSGNSEVSIDIDFHAR